MIGHVKNVSRFGVFITIATSEISEDDLLSLGHLYVEKQDRLTGLLRWSEIPSGEKFYKNETLHNLKIKLIREDKKIELSLISEDFLEKFEHKIATTLETLKVLQIKNQKVRDL